MKGLALGIIDAQRGFMPAEEGDRLSLAGFGELAVSNGEAIVPNVNKLLAGYAVRGYTTFITQDWHPVETAHFSTQPNYATTWPTHCISNTPGAELHPAIAIPQSALKIKKGIEVLEQGEDDQSYSGYNGIDDMGRHLGDLLRERNISHVALGGLALDYCVGKTALDLRTKLDLDVVVAIDATRGIADESINAMLEQFAENNIETVTTDKVLALL